MSWCVSHYFVIFFVCHIFFGHSSHVRLWVCPPVGPLRCWLGCCPVRTAPAPKTLRSAPPLVQHPPQASCTAVTNLIASGSTGEFASTFVCVFVPEFAFYYYSNLFSISLAFLALRLSVHYYYYVLLFSFFLFCYYLSGKFSTLP